ncbi:BQ5605_C006g04158 [Microbotryum silenes-dioicae]|uniref:BQ5605_C006g04158 protein n=1 Tax=Microbotryum silenes-dioicae TaxID=796604 RepID=A0A2X0MTA3_9BASI|nr:BQ5605_C006g04158 [Microbotryum silenes-dioicae]
MLRSSSIFPKSRRASSRPPALRPLSISQGKWVNAASKWCNYQLRARVYPRSLTHLPRW